MAKTDDSPYDLLLQRVERLEHENETLRAAVERLRQDICSLRDTLNVAAVCLTPPSVDPTFDLLGGVSLGHRAGWPK